MIIDAHHHVWDPAARRHAWLDGLPSLRRRFGPDDFQRAAASQGVTASVLVQVLPDPAETEEFLAIAAATAAPAAGAPTGATSTGADDADATGVAGAIGTGATATGTELAGTEAGRTGPELTGTGATAARATRTGAAGAEAGATETGMSVAGVVGWVDLTGPDVAGELARLRELPGGERLVGIRHLVQDEPDPGWLDRPEVRRGLRAVGDEGLAYDLLIRPHQLPAALRVTAALDGVRFVLDHAAKPPIAVGIREPWAAQIAELAARPNVACKVSGLVTEAAADWQPGQLAPYVDVLVTSFGPDRLMFGSDWPVCLLAATYDEVAELARDLLSRHLSPAELLQVFGATARCVYNLAATG